MKRPLSAQIALRQVEILDRWKVQKNLVHDPTLGGPSELCIWIKWGWSKITFVFMADRRCLGPSKTLPRGLRSVADAVLFHQG